MTWAKSDSRPYGRLHRCRPPATARGGTSSIGPAWHPGLESLEPPAQAVAGGKVDGFPQQEGHDAGEALGSFNKICEAPKHVRLVLGVEAVSFDVEIASLLLDAVPPQAPLDRKASPHIRAGQARIPACGDGAEAIEQEYAPEDPPQRLRLGPTLRRRQETLSCSGACCPPPLPPRQRAPAARLSG